MSIDITIKQNNIWKRTMPLEVILGTNLHYGNFVNDQLRVGELGRFDFIAYNPAHIGRGISVIWNPGETRKLELHLPQPSTSRELADLYATVERMVRYWNAELVVNGSGISLSDFLAGYKDAVAYNENEIKHFSQLILDGVYDDLTLYSAMWPLTVGKDEARTFVNSTNAFSDWLHWKQSVDACYAAAEFSEGVEGIFGRFLLKNGISFIFQNKPAVPFGVTDRKTGAALQCDDWRVLLTVEGEDKPVGELKYDEFLNRIPKDKVLWFDSGHVQILPMSEEEIRSLIG